MLRSTLHTIMSHRLAVGLSAVALLGGGAALASPGDPSESPDVDPLDVVTPDDTPATPDIVPNEELNEELNEETPESEALEDVVDEATEDPEGPEAIEEYEGPEESDDDGWALGRDEQVDGLHQQGRVARFCAERMDEAEAAADEAGAGPVGVPPFCTVEDGPVAPNAHGRNVAEQARNAERPQGAGPPEWANSNRPGNVPPGPATDVPRGNDESADTESDTDATVAPAGGDAQPGGPPAHANARANRG